MDCYFEKNTRDSPVSGCICLIGLHIHLTSKDLTFDNLFDTLSRTKYNLIRNAKILQGIPLFQAVSASWANIYNFNVQNIAFDTLFETVSQKYINKQKKYNWISVFKKLQGIPLFQAVAAS